jgi:hypothetical protein
MKKREEKAKQHRCCIFILFLYDLLFFYLLNKAYIGLEILHAHFLAQWHFSGFIKILDMFSGEGFSSSMEKAGCTSAAAYTIYLYEDNPIQLIDCNYLDMQIGYISNQLTYDTSAINQHTRDPIDRFTPKHMSFNLPPLFYFLTLMLYPK